MPMWNPHCETMPRPELERLQLERLRATVARAAEHVPFYRERFAAKGVSSASLASSQSSRASSTVMRLTQAPPLPP